MRDFQQAPHVVLIYIIHITEIKKLKWRNRFPLKVKVIGKCAHMAVNTEMWSPVYGFHTHDVYFHPRIGLGDSHPEKKYIALLLNLIFPFHQMS